MNEKHTPNTPLGDAALKTLKIQAENLHYLMSEAYRKLENIRELHPEKNGLCIECNNNFPCSTIRALEGGGQK